MSAGRRPACRSASFSLLSPSLPLLLLLESLLSLLLSPLLLLSSPLLDMLPPLPLSSLSELLLPLLLVAEEPLPPSPAAAAGGCASSSHCGAFQEVSSKGGLHSVATAILSSCSERGGSMHTVCRDLCGRLVGTAQQARLCAAPRASPPAARLPALPAAVRAGAAPGGPRPPASPPSSPRRLAWKTTGRSQGDASSTSTAGCRQWMKCRRLATAASQPAAGRQGRSGQRVALRNLARRTGALGDAERAPSGGQARAGAAGQAGQSRGAGGTARRHGPHLLVPPGAAARGPRPAAASPARQSRRGQRRRRQRPLAARRLQGNSEVANTGRRAWAAGTASAFSTTASSGVHVWEQSAEAVHSESRV